MRRAHYLLILLLSFTSLAFSAEHALDFEQVNKEEFKLAGYIYQQPHRIENDPAGDLLLINTIKFLPKSLISQLRNKKIKELEDTKKNFKIFTELYPDFVQKAKDPNDYDHQYKDNFEGEFKVPVEGRKRPFYVKKLKKMFLHILIREHANGITPKLGKVDNWSKEFRQKTKGKFLVLKRFSKLFSCLTRGVCSRFIVSGTEDLLREKVLEQEYRSITLDKMFTMSYRINDGDVYKTLLTIENVLSRDWQRRNRSELAVTKRLKPFTNYHFKTDIFGQWYHLFGIMLYGYSKGALLAEFVGRVESLGSKILSGFKAERQENAINIHGGKVGAYLKRAIKKKKYLKHEFNSNYLEEDYYRKYDNMEKRVKQEKKKIARGKKKEEKKRKRALKKAKREN